MNGELECHPLDDSLASMQSLKEISGCAAQPLAAKQTPDKENEHLPSQVSRSLQSPPDHLCGL